MKKFTKIISLIAAFTITASMMTACGGSKQDSAKVKSTPEEQAQTAEIKKDEVIISISNEPDNLDPCLGWGHGTSPLIQSSLIRYKQDMSFENDLATEYTVSEDGLTWTFKLREDAYFTDGEQVTSEDVVFTFETAKKLQSSLDLTFMDKVEAPDEFTVIFTLNRPTAPFANTLATTGIVPQHAYGDNYGIQPIGSGPYKLLQWNKGEQIILEANENYYDQVPAIKKVTIVFMEEDSAFAAAKSGQVDIALTSATLATNAIDGYELKSISTLDNRGLTLPMEPNTGKKTESGYIIGNDVTSHIEIRKALAYGIDRNAIAEYAANGFADPAYSENDGMPWCSDEIKIETDKEYAKKLLSDNGWKDTDGDGIVEKDGLKAEFNCLYVAGDSFRQAVVMATAQQAEELGIKITVEGSNWDEISKRMFSEAVLMGWGSTNPYTSYCLFHSSYKLRDDYYNPEGFDDKKVDEYMEAAMQALTPEESYKYWKLAQWDGTTGTSMLGGCPWVYLVNMHHLYYIREGLDIGQQQLHSHGASWTLLQNLKDWAWK